MLVRQEGEKMRNRLNAEWERENHGPPNGSNPKFRQSTQESPDTRASLPAIG